MHNERIEANYKNDGQNHYGRLTYEKEKPAIVLNPLLKSMLKPHVNFKPEPQIEIYEGHKTISNDVFKITSISDWVDAVLRLKRRK